MKTMQQYLYLSRVRIIGLMILLVVGMVLAACSALVSPDLAADAEDAPTAVPEPQPEADVESTAATELAPEEMRVAPMQISISELGLDLPVVPMGWRMVVVDGAQTTTWDVPETSLGWQINSASPGEEGNMLIAGHQALGDALLAPLALDEFAPEQEIMVTDETGATFLYQITAVSAPLPVIGANEDEEAQAAAYTALDGDARLTLISGWPDFTTTHRVFAVAELLGPTE